jgi:hypothetical protein
MRPGAVLAIRGALCELGAAVGVAHLGAIALELLVLFFGLLALAV